MSLVSLIQGSGTLDVVCSSWLHYFAPLSRFHSYDVINSTSALNSALDYNAVIDTLHVHLGK